MSPFSICGGGVCWFNCFLSPLETQLGRFGVRNSTCVLEKQGGEKAGGVQYEFPRGCSAGTSFLLLASFSSCCFGLGLPGLLAIFFLCLDMFPSVSTYKVKGTCLLKPKVRGLAVAWPLSVCGGLPASACLDSRPSRGQDVCPDLPRGC